MIATRVSCALSYAACTAAAASSSLLLSPSSSTNQQALSAGCAGVANVPHPSRRPCNGCAPPASSLAPPVSGRCSLDDDSPCGLAAATAPPSISSTSAAPVDASPSSRALDAPPSALSIHEIIHSPAELRVRARRQARPRGKSFAARGARGDLMMMVMSLPANSLRAVFYTPEPKCAPGRNPRT